MIVTEREREAETQAEREAGSMHREPDVGLDPASPGSRPGPKAGAKPLRHPGIPPLFFKCQCFPRSSPSLLTFFFFFFSPFSLGDSIYIHGFKHNLESYDIQICILRSIWIINP